MYMLSLDTTYWRSSYRMNKLQIGALSQEQFNQNTLEVTQDIPVVTPHKNISFRKMNTFRKTVYQRPPSRLADIYTQNTPEDHQNTPEDHHNTPEDHHNTPEDHQNTPEDHHNTPEDHQNTPEDHQNTPEDPHNTPEDHQNTPEDHQNTPEDPVVYSIIPLNLFQTWHTLDLPPKMKENVELLQTQNPEFKYYLYDDAMCRDFIEKNFPTEVLYTYDKLKPGAYKADLWRYCVLYKYGGVYLDIKYKCINNFKLIDLTDKEHYVKDRSSTGKDKTGRSSNNGIYQALLSCMPYNTILYKCIFDIVNSAQNDIHTFNPLSVTGPALMARYFYIDELNELRFEHIGEILIDKNNKNTHVLIYYPEYREEQRRTEKTIYYAIMWAIKDIYNYPTLKIKKKINLTRTITKNINGEETLFYSSNPTIIQLNENSYLVNLRWVNYYLNPDGFQIIKPKIWMSLNSRYTVDAEFNQISDEIFLKEYYENNYIGLEDIRIFNGLEDIRIFNYNDKYYYNSSEYDIKRQLISTAVGNYDINDEVYELDRNIILPSFYDLDKIQLVEKNWSFLNYKNELCMIYNWFPLQIGKPKFETNELDIIEIKYNIPEYFKEARGSTCGFIKDNEIWFVVHKVQIGDEESNSLRNYQHFFAIFDLDMNLRCYSESFKFGDCKIEFCLGLIVQDKEIILSYSLLDSYSIIATYDIDYINNGIQWYINDLK